MNAKPILIVHPKDKTTVFLDRIKNHLIDTFRDDTHHFNIHPNDNSHAECLKIIESHDEKGVVIFLGHGRSDKLFGSRGEWFDKDEFVSPEAIVENPGKYYNNEDFINENNVGIFSKKRIFCLACNSNKDIAQWAVDNGAQAFLGFGDIPTSTGEFSADGIENVSTDIVKLMKTELNYIIKASLTYSISQSHSFEQLQSTIQLVTNQRIVEILVNQKHFKERHLLADYLYYLKREIKVWGNKKAKLIG
jgi:hypothetical protein